MTLLRTAAPVRTPVVRAGAAVRAGASAARVRHPRSSGAGVSSWLPVLLVLVLIAAALLVPAAVVAAGPALAVAGIALGVPHGAVDHLVPGRLGAGRSMPRVLLGYVGVAVVATVAFLLAPALVLGVFLLVSLAHFGWGEVTFSAERRSRAVPSVGAGALPALAHGLAVVALPLTVWPSEAAAVLTPLSPSLAGVLTSGPGALLTAGVLALALAAVLALHARGDDREAAELGLVTALFLLVPPLAAFGVYFGLWHAVRHTARLLPLLAPHEDTVGRLRVYARAAALPTLLALASLAAVAATVTSGRLDPTVVSAALGVLLALTFPHVGVVALLDRSRQV